MDNHRNNATASHCELMDAPLEGLSCISAQEAAVLKSVFDVVTIRDFANLEFFKYIASLATLGEYPEMEKGAATENMLDGALEMTFPASDPVSIDSNK
jgi:hypothetical protein